MSNKQKVEKMDNLTIQKVAEYAENNGVNVELYTTYFDRFGDEIQDKTTFVGVELTKFQYSWWKYPVNKHFSVEENTEALFFDHKYNSNTGRSIKGWKTGFNAECKILNI